MLKEMICFLCFGRQYFDLQLRLGLQVLGVTRDGAKSNRKMFRMHRITNGVPYKTCNYYTKTNDPIFFIFHILKTLRNCFARGQLWVSYKVTTVSMGKL